MRYELILVVAAAEGGGLPGVLPGGLWGHDGQRQGLVACAARVGVGVVGPHQFVKGVGQVVQALGQVLYVDESAQAAAVELQVSVCCKAQADSARGAHLHLLYVGAREHDVHAAPHHRQHQCRGALRGVGHQGAQAVALHGLQAYLRQLWSACQWCAAHGARALVYLLHAAQQGHGLWGALCRQYLYHLGYACHFFYGCLMGV